MNAVKDLFLRAGGYRRVAEMLPAPLTTVQYWWDNGFIPSRKQSWFLAKLNAAGIECGPNDLIDTNGKKLKSVNKHKESKGHRQAPNAI